MLRLLTLLGFEEAIPRFWIGAGLMHSRWSALRLRNRLTRSGFRREQVLIGSEVPVKIGKSWLERRIGAVSQSAALGAHCAYSEKLSEIFTGTGCKLICIVRDPRAIVMSHVNFLKKTKGHFFHREYMQLPSDADRASLVIDGGRLGRYEIRSLAERYHEFLCWKQDPNAIMVRFEDLVGAKGGGSAASQVKAVRRVSRHLELDLNQAKLEDVSRELFGSSYTFRTGQIDAWKNELSVEQQNRVQYALAPILTELGISEPHD